MSEGFPETELYLDPAEEEELYALYASGDFIDASELEAMIRAMPDDGDVFQRL